MAKKEELWVKSLREQKGQREAEEARPSTAFFAFFAEENALRRGETPELCPALCGHFALATSEIERRDLIDFARVQYRYAVDQNAYDNAHHSFPYDYTNRMGIAIDCAMRLGLNLANGSPDWKLLGTDRTTFIKDAEEVLEGYIRRALKLTCSVASHGNSYIDFERVQDGLNKLAVIRDRPVSLYEVMQKNKDDLDADILWRFLRGAKLREEWGKIKSGGGVFIFHGPEHAPAINLDTAYEFLRPAREAVLKAFNDHGDFRAHKHRLGGIFWNNVRIKRTRTDLAEAPRLSLKVMQYIFDRPTYKYV